MVEGAPRFFEVARKIVEMTEGKVFVAHNVRFDYNFLKEEFRRLGFTFKRKTLCTVRLTRRVFKGLPSYSLENLIRHFDLEVARRHRALDDTLATVEVLRRIIDAEKEETSAKDLINLGVKETRLPPNITLDILHALPEDCGIYYFYNAQGDVIYVGKSINIKKRVMGHFASDTRKAQKIQRSIHDITYEITGSELIALLLEESEIKRISPIYNSALKPKTFPYGIYYFEDEKGYPNLKVGDKNIDHILIAEFSSLREAKGALAYIVKEFELCRCLCNLNTRHSPCLDFQIQNCSGAFIGKEEVDSYTERFHTAMEALRLYPAFPEDLLLIDKGRELDEHSVVLIENGHYLGFGFVERTEALDYNDIKNSITVRNHNKDVIYIIKDYLRKNPKVNVIQINR